LSKETFYRVGKLAINTGRRQATLDGEVLDLAPKEFELLAFLAENKGLVFNRAQLLKKIWGYDYVGNTRTIDVHVRWLRQKIEAVPGEPKRLITVRGGGYKLEG
jgi:two-component system OmpR family response regulator